MSMYSQPLFIQALKSPNTPAKQTDVGNKIHSETWIWAFSFWHVLRHNKMRFNEKLGSTRQPGIQNEHLIFWMWIDIHFLKNLINPDNPPFGLARFDYIHISPQWNVSAVVKVTDKIRSKWVLNELAFNNAKYAKPGLAFWICVESYVILTQANETDDFRSQDLVVYYGLRVSSLF